MRFIGDVHGKYDRYKKIAKQANRSIQVGDFGMGFSPQHPFSYSKTPGQHTNHKFIRGNHDSPSHCAKQAAKWWIPDGSVLQDKMMFVGGALSIDKASRVEGVSYWSDEELSHERFHHIINTYETVKPLVMVTHEAPEYIIREVMTWYNKSRIPSHTREAFQQMWEIHSPALWVFGHWHQSVNTEIAGCRFVCLNELEHIDIDLSRYGIDESKLWA
jgi:hypothetical protein